MYLSKLEIFGFKSFADRTEFTLKPGLTGIVGPNGCGKSNVVDAIKWVLGEQSAKSLRGTEMMDVIFNGAGTRKPLGMAEVTLTFSEIQGVLPLDQEEVSVTRRLFRSGESEYLLNKQICRLKDIRELFMDTGIGKEAYSVIEQGKIDVLLQSNAMDRRAIFEEAAGISRYKAKRKETERRLERIDGNLQRLCDIIEEVEKQIRSVKAQAGRARRYREILEEWKGRRLAIAGARRVNLQADQARIESNLFALREKEAVAAAQLSTLEADLLTAEEELGRLEEKLLGVRAEAAQTDSGIETERERTEMERERNQHLREEADRLGREARQHRDRIQEIASDLRAKRKLLAEAEDEVRAIEEAILSGTAKEEELVGREHSMRAREEDRKTRLLDALGSRAQAQNARVALESSLESIVQRLDRLEGEGARLDDERQELARRRAEGDADRRTALDEVDRRQVFLGAREQFGGRLDALQHRREEEIRGLERRRAAVISSLEVLNGMRSQMAGVQEGVKSLLSVDGNGGFPGLGEMIADCIDVDLRFARALEAALGGRAQAILANGTQSAVEAIQFLKDGERGRASLLPLDHPSRNGARPSLAGPGLIGSASSLVRAPERLQPMIELLLGHTWVVEDLETALRFSRNGGTGEAFVTLDGDLIDPLGLISGGRGEKAGGLILNRSQLRSLEEEKGELDDQLTSLRRLIEETDERLDGLGVKMAEERKAIEEGEGVASDAHEEVRRLDQSLSLTGERLAIGRMETDEFRRERTSVESRLEEASQEAIRADAEARALEAEATRAVEEAADVRREREALSQEMTRDRVTEARLTAQRQGLQSALAELVRNLQEHRRSRSDARVGIHEAVRRSREAEAAAQAAEQRLAGFLAKREDLRVEEVRLSERRSERSSTISASREEARAAEERVSRASSEIQEARLEENQTTLRIESLTHLAREELGVSVEDLPEPPEDWNEEEEKSRVSELKDKIDRMGNVNLEALDQLAELEERYIFLKAQRDDLERAKRSLQEAMRRIARTCEERFQATFEAVRGQFHEIFRKLFGGGKADIYLQEAEDGTEAGVEIMARPPGKEPRHISLLSGGEKTMTTIALLFAIFRSRPSPFCILDEVDAALDESNINRFVILLREFLSQSQFLIITHSKPTMATADVLYGVTQEERGVTKRIAVRFEDLERQVA